MCSSAFGPTPLVVSGGAGSAVFARIHESDFECRGCGLRSPLALGFDAEAECLRCGLRQAFPEGQWEEGLDVAHGVADLCGPDPEGRFRSGASIAAKNPRKSLGLEHTRTESTQSTMIISGGGMKRHTLRVVVSPGHPLCDACRAPLAVQLDGRGNAQTVCPRCSDRAVYALPAGAQKAPRLLAAIGAEYRTDRPAVRMNKADEAGVVALSCPTCGAALAVAEGAEMATCQFCRTTARIARRAWVRAKGAAPPFEPFWVLLDGPSKQRAKIAGEAAEEDDDEAEFESALAEAEAMRVAVEPNRWDGQTIRMVVGLVILVGVFVVYGGIRLYEYVDAHYELGGEAPPKPAPRPPARPAKR